MLTDRQKSIFGPYWDGTGEVFADPVAVHRRLQHALHGCLDKTVEAAGSPVEEVAFEARERLLAAARFAFLMSFDRTTGEGAGENQVVEVLNAYLDWVDGPDGVKKNTASPPTSPPPTGPAPSSSPTKPRSASGTTSAGCGCS